MHTSVRVPSGYSLWYWTVCLPSSSLSDEDDDSVPASDSSSIKGKFLNREVLGPAEAAAAAAAAPPGLLGRTSGLPGRCCCCCCCCWGTAPLPLISVAGI